MINQNIVKDLTGCEIIKKKYDNGLNDDSQGYAYLLVAPDHSFRRTCLITIDDYGSEGVKVGNDWFICQLDPNLQYGGLDREYATIDEFEDDIVSIIKSGAVDYERHNADHTEACAIDYSDFLYLDKLKEYIVDCFDSYGVIVSATDGYKEHRDNNDKWFGCSFILEFPDEDMQASDCDVIRKFVNNCAEQFFITHTYVFSMGKQIDMFDKSGAYVRLISPNDFKVVIKLIAR